MERMTKKAILLLLIQLLILGACTKTEEVRPIRRNITEYVFATGTLQADERYNLVAQADGYLSKVNFKENDSVHSNQIMAIIDNQTNIINTQGAAEQLAIANYNLADTSPAMKQLSANIDFAEKKYQQDLQQQERYKILLESNSIARIEYENTVIATQNSLSNLNALKEQYKNLKQQAQQQMLLQKNNYQINQTNMAYNQVKAPASGTVLKRYKQSGDFVRKGDIIAAIGNVSSTIAQINIDESNIAKIRIGQKILVRLNTHPNEVFEAKVAEIQPAFDDATQSFICKAKFIAMPDFKVSGTQLEANIEIAQRKNVLVIPRELMGFGNKVQIKGHKELQVINTGIVSNEYVEVVSGLNEKDILIPLKP
jgi:multidrug resistance efflux pump